MASVFWDCDASLDNGSIRIAFSERLMSDILLSEKVITSRTNYAQVYQREFEGLFVNVERIDKSFLESAFETAMGFSKTISVVPDRTSVLQSLEEYGLALNPKPMKTKDTAR